MNQWFNNTIQLYKVTIKRKCPLTWKISDFIWIPFRRHDNKTDSLVIECIKKRIEEDEK